MEAKFESGKHFTKFLRFTEILVSMKEAGPKLRILKSVELQNILNLGDMYETGLSKIEKAHHTGMRRC